MSKNSDADNHANQMNPNNDAYWSGRGEDERPDDWQDRAEDEPGGVPPEEPNTPATSK